MTVVTTPEQPSAAEPAAGAGTKTELEISRLRARIDEIDHTLISLWQERANLSQQVGAARVAAGGTRLALSRETEILDRFHRELGPIGTQLGMLILRAGRGPL